MRKAKKANSRFDFVIQNNILSKSKRSQVSILVLVLIILIILIAILIVWNLVVPLVREKSEEVEPRSFIIKLDIEEVILFETGALKVRVNRGSGKGEINGLKFVFNGEGQSASETIENNLLEELETKTYSFSPVLGIGKIDSVSVVPVIGNNLGMESKSEISEVIKIPLGLVSWWRFDNEQDFVDGNNGVLISGASFVDGRLVSGAGDYFNVQENSNLDINDKLALSFWIKTNVDSGVIIRKQGNYRVSLVDKKIEFSFSNGNIQTINELDVGWNHVLISLDVGGIKKIYINNELELFQVNYNFNVNDNNLTIGEISGEFDEVMFFNEALAVGEAEAIYDNQKDSFV